MLQQIKQKVYSKEMYLNSSEGNKIQKYLTTVEKRSVFKNLLKVLQSLLFTRLSYLITSQNRLTYNNNFSGSYLCLFSLQ